MLDTFVAFVFWAAVGAAPQPTAVNSYEDADACFKAGGFIANVYKGDTVEEALDSVEPYCFLPPVEGTPTGTIHVQITVAPVESTVPETTPEQK